MSASRQGDALFMLLSSLGAHSTVARMAVKTCSARHFPDAHALFAESASLLDESTDFVMVQMRRSWSYGSVNLAELRAAEPSSQLWRPSCPGDAGRALRLAHGEIASALGALAGVDVAYRGELGDLTRRHAAIAVSLGAV